MTGSDDLNDLDDDDFFLDDDPVEEGVMETPSSPWKVLIVDDEGDIHQVTILALRGFSFMGREIEFMSAMSGEEARQAIDENEDIALILLDVVMESDHAGLEFARWLRDERGIEDTRIILRTGQPGQAPERQVVLAYDINDYKAKSELTSERLFAAIVTALRGYEELQENKRLRDELLTLLATQGIAEQALMDVLPFPVLSVDAIGQVNAVNVTLAKLCGTDADALVGQPADMCLPVTLSAALVSPDTVRRLVEIGGRDFYLLSQDVMAADGAPYGKVACLVPDKAGA